MTLSGKVFKVTAPGRFDLGPAPIGSSEKVKIQTRSAH